MDTELKELQKSINQIQVRNKRVELDKAWETSLIRKISIAVLTYFVMVLLMWSINVDKPYINAIVPTLGYVLSTLSMGVVKRIWIINK